MWRISHESYVELLSIHLNLKTNEKTILIKSRILIGTDYNEITLSKKIMNQAFKITIISNSLTQYLLI